MNLTSEVSAWGMLAGGLTWIAFGAVAAAGHIRAPRAWAQLGSRWGWCHLLLGVGLTCFPADALLGDYSAPVLSCLGAVVTISALALLLSGRRSVVDDLDSTPADNRPTYRMPPGPGPQPYGQPPGQPVAGQPVAGQPVAGQPVAGQPVPGQPVPGPPVHGQPPPRQAPPGPQPQGWPAPGADPYGRPPSGPQQPYGRPPTGPQQGRPAPGSQPHGRQDPANPHASTRPGARRFHF
jgi:hypothetical protein